MGHNRGWEEAASMFSGAPIELKTCNAALLEATGKSWNEVCFPICSCKDSLHFLEMPVIDTTPGKLYLEMLRHTYKRCLKSQYRYQPIVFGINIINKYRQYR